LWEGTVEDRRDVLAQLGGTVADDAVEWGADHGVGRVVPSSCTAAAAFASARGSRGSFGPLRRALEHRHVPGRLRHFGDRLDASGTGADYRDPLAGEAYWLQAHQRRVGLINERLYKTIPLGGEMLSPDQIARTAVFLASEDANAITGQVLHVNGGSHMP
jgi:Enoyl-(Acyl carrier protein) reductase